VGVARYVLLGTAVAIEARGQAVARRVDALLGPFVAGPGPVERTYWLSSASTGRWCLQGDDGTAREDDAGTVEGVLLAALNLLVVGGYRGFAAHAGVVAADGRVVCFPAASGVGKSTLTAACARIGFDYVSDEALCIDPANRGVVPYPRPVSLSPDSCALLGLGTRRSSGVEVTLSLDQLGARPATGALELAHVVQLERCTGAPRLEARDRIVAVTTLLSMAFNHYRRPEESIELVTSLARDACTWHLTYGDAAEAALLLRERFAA
jgi:hypothetical protein